VEYPRGLWKYPTVALEVLAVLGGFLEENIVNMGPVSGKHYDR